MAFCRNCGSKLQDNDLFCSGCGAPQNQSSSPQGGSFQPNLAYQTAPNNGQIPVPSINMQAVEKYIGEVLGIIRAVLLAPISTVQAVAKNPYRQSSFVLAGVMGIIQALLFLWSSKQVLGKISSSLNSIPLIGGALGQGFSTYFRLPNGKMFFTYFFVFLIAMAGLALGTYLMGRYVFKGRMGMLSPWNVALCSSIPYSAGVFAGIILSYINVLLGQSVMMVGSFVSIFCVYRGAKEGMEISDDSAVFTVPISYAAMMLFVYLAMKIFV